jgi:hypothetical protein
MVQKTINAIADQILNLDEEVLTEILPQYKKIMEEYSPTPEWERSVIAFFLINAVRVKNNLAHAHTLKKGLIHLLKKDTAAPIQRLRVVK